MYVRVYFQNYKALYCSKQVWFKKKKLTGRNYCYYLSMLECEKDWQFLFIEVKYLADKMLGCYIL